MCRKKSDQGIPEKRSEKKEIWTAEENEGGSKRQNCMKTSDHVTYVILEAARR